MRQDLACDIPSRQLMRVIAGIVADEYQRETKRSLPVGEVLRWDAKTLLDEDGVGLDSLVLLNAAQRVADFFALRDVGYEDYLLVSRTLGDWAELVAKSLSVKSETITFRTSGSTGTPKSCTHPFAHMVEEAVALARLAGPPKRIVSCVAPHHIYGFLHTVVSAVALGLETLDMRSVPPGSTPSRLRPGDLVVATPHIWSLMAEGEGRFPDGVAGMTSTAPMSVDLCDRLGRLGLSRILEIYGSSETSGVGWRTDLNAPYQLLPWWRRQDDRVARSDGIARGLPDVVQWTDDSHLRPLRREDGAIQVAGVNVYPSRVAEAIRRHPSVAECIVRRAGVGDASRLEAFVVVGDASADKENFALELANHCQRELSPAERPMRIAIGLDLPFDAMGKPTAW